MQRWHVFSFEWLRNLLSSRRRQRRPPSASLNEALARIVPRGRALILNSATHDLVADVLAPPVLEFFAGDAHAR